MLWWSRRQSKSPNAEVRRRAADKLGLSKNLGAVEPLHDLLDDPDKNVRRAAADALVNLALTWLDPARAVAQRSDRGLPVAVVP